MNNVTKTKVITVNVEVFITVPENTIIENDCLGIGKSIIFPGGSFSPVIAFQNDKTGSIIWTDKQLGKFNSEISDYGDCSIVDED